MSKQKETQQRSDNLSATEHLVKNLNTDDMVVAPPTHNETVEFIRNSIDLKPDFLKMRELKWKTLIRYALRGKNIMFTGPSGCGKTMACLEAVKALKRPFFYFNLGSTQDPRTTLIGTRQAKDGSTYFVSSLFVKAITTPHSMILLDEITRAHPEAWNILLTVLDYNQRYLRLDESEDAETIKVAEGVTFLCTANVGNQYTATRTMDRALTDRFSYIEMDVLDENEEAELLMELYPEVDKEDIHSLARIAAKTRTEVNSEAPKIDTIISTRQTVEATSLLYDGFTLQEVAEVQLYPIYPEDGGVDSPRSFVKKIVQKEIDDGSSDELFSQDDIEKGKQASKMNT